MAHDRDARRASINRPDIDADSIGLENSLQA
jgi:hypothetical protein